MLSMPSIIHFILGALAAFLPVTDSVAFLDAGQVNTTQLEERLLSELADALRPSSDNIRIPRLQDELFQLFSSVPAEKDGSLNHHVVRYVLHRHFVAKHGWFIRGLEPDGDHRDDATEDSHAMTDLQEWVPSYLQRFLEKLNVDRGLTLREVSVLAATLEDLIHKEAVQRLDLAWRALGFPPGGTLTTSQVTKILETYMMIYNQGGNTTFNSASDVEDSLSFFASNVPDWKEQQAWLRRIRDDVFPVRSSGGSLNFTQIARLVEEIGERYGNFNDMDCSKLKKTLLEIESPKRLGRVRLSEFYKKGLYSNWEFTEKKEYLRSLGALDESDPKQPYIILPNYLASRPNCLVCSNFYVVCCKNECEDLMNQIEAEVSNHTVSPAAILRLIPTLATDTVKAPRKLSGPLMDRLRQVALANNGKVPIHGRLFAQWMHHAFPRECPFPHEAGASSPQTPNEWMKSAGEESHVATEIERKYHVNTDNCQKGDCNEDHELPWSMSEELLTGRPRAPARVKPRPWQDILRKVASFGVVGTMLTWATLSWRSLRESSRKTFGRKTHYA